MRQDVRTRYHLYESTAAYRGCSSYSIELVTLAHDNASRHKLNKKPPFAIDKPFGTRATPEEKSWDMAQRAADFAYRRATFCAGADQHQP